MKTIFFIIGSILTILGILSGFALFLKAVSNSLEHSNSATLWGLFIIGLSTGLAILAYFL
jgi:hypothetical protein